MLSDEEREALRNFKSEYETCKYNSSDLIIELNDAKIILNLIEKQSKEIEELNKSDASKEQSSMKYYNLYKELVDKIKAKIEELDIKIQCCTYADDDVEEYKQDIEKEKARLLRDKKTLQSLLGKE